MPKTETGHTEAFYARVDAVVVIMLKNDRYLQSKRRDEITEKIIAQFGVSNRMAWKYLAEAKKEIRKLSKVKKKNAISKAILDREYIIASSKSGGDDKLALEAMKDRDKLIGLYVDEVKMKHTGEITEKIVFVENLDE